MPHLEDAAGRSGLFTDGDWILSQNMTPNGGIGVIQLKHVGVGEFFPKDFQFISDETFKSLGCTEVRPGDILISRMADPIGRACVVPRLPFRAVTAVDVSILRVDDEIADPWFVAYLCNSPAVRQQVEQSARGTTRSRITRTELGALLVPLPRVEVQRRIASRLGIADRLRRARRIGLEICEGLLGAVFLEMFGDRKSPKNGCAWSVVSELCESITDCVNKTAPSAEVVTPFRMLRTTNVRHGEIDVENVRYVDKATYDTWTRRSKPMWGDVILTREAPLGEVGILRSKANVFLGQRLVQYRVDTSKATPEFLAYGLMSRDVQVQIHRLGDGSTVEHVAVPDCESLLVPHAALPIQQRFSVVERLFDRSRAAQREALRQAEHLFQTLLHDAFKGPNRVLD